MGWRGTGARAKMQEDGKRPTLPSATVAWQCSPCWGGGGREGGREGREGGREGGRNREDRTNQHKYICQVQSQNGQR